jgi:hypothetical protein
LIERSCPIASGVGEAGEHDRVLQRQDGQRRREGQLVGVLLGLLLDELRHHDILTVIETLSRGAGVG